MNAASSCSKAIKADEPVTPHGSVGVESPAHQELFSEGPQVFASAELNAGQEDLSFPESELLSVESCQLRLTIRGCSNVLGEASLS
jgi:hypothetical protein